MKLVSYFSELWIINYEFLKFKSFSENIFNSAKTEKQGGATWQPRIGSADVSMTSALTWSTVNRVELTGGPGSKSTVNVDWVNGQLGPTGQWAPHVSWSGGLLGSA